MATFTETQKLNISKILGITADYLEDHLGYRSEAITDEVVTQVTAELTRWTTYGAKFTKIHPRERNYGVETYPEALRNDIRANIANLLFLTEYVNIGAGRLLRG